MLCIFVGCLLVVSALSLIECSNEATKCDSIAEDKSSFALISDVVGHAYPTIRLTFRKLDWSKRANVK